LDEITLLFGGGPSERPRKRLMNGSENSRQAARVRTLQEHIRLANLHDLDGIMQTFGMGARYNDEPWDEHRIGRPAVQSYYAQVMIAVPDLVIDVKKQYFAAEAIVMEVVAFDEADKLAGEKIYYDRASILAQLGFFHEPVTLIGRVMGSLSLRREWFAASFSSAGAEA
jgi:hypothetical protein